MGLEIEWQASLGFKKSIVVLVETRSLKMWMGQLPHQEYITLLLPEEDVAVTVCQRGNALTAMFHKGLAISQSLSKRGPSLRS
jgi:hypothetical protein